MAKHGNISFDGDDAEEYFRNAKVGDIVEFKIQARLNDVSRDEFGAHAEFGVDRVMEEDKEEGEGSDELTKEFISEMNSHGLHTT